MLPLKNIALQLVTTTVIILYLMRNSQEKTAVIRPPKRKGVDPSVNYHEDFFTCRVSLEDTRIKQQLGQLGQLPTIYVITPTYPRREQAAELTRLGQTLLHVPKIHWVVADDNHHCNDMLEKLLAKFGLPFTLLASPMPEEFRRASDVPRGVANRRAALGWIRKNALTGVIYFGDDDNTYDLNLFQEIRYTRKVSMFPVGLIGDFAVSSPVIKEGRVVGFFDPWPAGRKLPVDMAGFALNVAFFLRQPNATMPYIAGHEEDQFLASMGINLDDIEPVADSCTKVLVWHTRTVTEPVPVMNVESLDLDTNLKALLKELKYLGMSDISSKKGIKTFITYDGIKQTN